MVRVVVVSLALVLGTTGCVVEPVDLSDRRCACAAGFECNQVLDRCCVPTTPLVEGFEMEWATATTIRWHWTPIPVEALGFTDYALILAENAADLEASTRDTPVGTARVFDGSVNPELAALNLPGTGSVGDLVVATTTDGLVPGTSYVAELHAADGVGCPWVTPTAVGHTTRSPAFRTPSLEEDPDATLLPTDVTFVPEVDGSGRELEWDTTSSPSCTSDRCGDNLRVVGVDAPLTDVAVSSFVGDARVAMLEMTVRHDSAAPSAYSRVWIRFMGDGVCGGSCGVAFRFEPFTLRPARAGEVVTQRLEIPLAELDYLYYADPGTERPECVMSRTLTHDELTSICEVNLGGSWVRGSRVWIDDIAVRY